MKRLFSTLLPILFALSLALVSVGPPLVAAERVALVIGNNDYPENSNFPDLKNCINDAKLMSKTLKSVGFEVVEAFDADLSTIDDALEKFEGKIEKGGTAVVYFAGHGIEYGGQNYLMASNAEFQARSRLTREAIEAEVFASAMVLAGAKSSFLFLDCCRELPQSAEWAGRGQKKFGLAEISIAGDVVISMAAAPGRQALEPAEAGGNSPYALALAKWIPSGEGHLDLFQKVRKEVHDMTDGQQRTWENGSFLESFFFAEGGAVKTPVDNTGAAQLAAMQAKIADLEKALAAKRVDAGSEARMKDELETMKRTVAVAEPVPGGGSFSTGSAGVRGFEGAKAGEVKMIGGIEFAWCPAGKFTMGSPAGEVDRGDDEDQVEVTLSKGFWMARTECTQAQWEKVMGENPSDYNGADLPVNGVSWVDVQKWLEKMNAKKNLPDGWKWRLPSEAQWEYACRAGTTTVFAFGDSLGSEQANFNWNDPNGEASKGQDLLKPTKGGNYEPNGWGLYDMHGNVGEWCADGYEKELRGGLDPQGNNDVYDRVCRDGGWNTFAKASRSANRGGLLRGFTWFALGFRVAVSPAASQ